MELKFVTATSRSAVVELTESGKFYTEKPYMTDRKLRR